MNLNRFHSQSLKTRITFLTLLIFVLSLWSLAFLTNQILRKDIEHLLSNQQLSTVTMLAREINRELNNRLTGLEEVAARLSTVMKNHPAELQTTLEQHPILHYLFNNGVFITGTDGQMLAECPLSTSPGNAMDIELVAKTIKTGKPTIGRPILSPRLTPVLTLAVPIRDDTGRVIGSIGGVINLRAPNFMDQVAENHYGRSGGFVLLIPQDRIVVTATDKSRIMEELPALGTNPALDRFRQGYEGSAVYTNSKGVEVLGSVKQIPVSGWLLSAILPTEEAFLPIRTMQKIVLLAAFFMTLLVGWLTWWGLKRQLEPLLRTAKILASVAEHPENNHPLPTLPIAVDDEIGQLIGGFNQLQATLAQRAAALQASERLNLSIIDSMPSQAVVVDREGVIKVTNKAWRRFTPENTPDPERPAPNTAVGANYLEICQASREDSADGASETYQGIVGVLEGRLSSFSLEYPCHSPSTQRWFSMVATPLTEPWPGALITHTDITVRKLTENALIRHHAHLEQLVNERTQQNETILNNALVGILYVKHGHIVSNNRRFDELFHYQPGELAGEPLEVLFPSTERYLATKKLALWVIGENNDSYSEQIQLQHKDGSLFWGEINGRTIDTDHPEEGSIWIIADISERRRVEQESIKLLQAVEQSPTSIVITNREGVIEYVNPFFTQITGYSAPEAIGHTPRVLKTDETPLSTYDDLWHTILDGRIWRGVLHNRCKDGHLIWERTSISPIFDATGEITHFVAVKEDITEQKRIEQQLEVHQEHLEDLVLERTAELKQALEAAQIADRTKDEFLANITHDLRTPLSAVIGFSGLARPLCTDARQRDYLDKVNNAGKTLSSLINDLLDLSKIAAGSMELDHHPFSLRQLISRCLSTISYKAEEKGLLLATQIDEKIPEVLVGDSLRIEQIVLNLLANAVKFTPSGQVALSVSLAEPAASGVGVSIAVKDSGIGMSEAVIARLFEPFRQGDASMTRRFGGTGLGLVICKRLVALMGGEINVSSQEHHGSLFEITLNLGLGTDSLPATAAKNKQAVVCMHYENVRVLVADDQALNRDLVHGLMAVVGINPNFARNGQEAVDILTHSTEFYDLVLMDIQMPIMDGLTATRLIRALPCFAQLPIIAMTAHTMMHEKDACLQAGMNGHIGKPFDEELFYKTLTKWIPASKQQLQNMTDAAPLPANPPVSLPALPGVDVPAGLALMQGDETRYRHWLGVFVEQAPI